MRKWGGMRVTLVGLITLVSMSEQLIFGDKQVAAAQSSAKQPSPFGALDFASRKEPIHIRSHDLEFFYNEKRIVYRGSVVATQGDSTLKSNTLTVTYEDAMTKAATQGEGANTTQGQQIKEIVAEEDVEITSTTRRATCTKAVFSDASRTIILTGNAVLRDGTNEVTGQKVTIYVDEGRTMVEGSPTMVLTPKQEDKGKKGEGVR